MKDNEKNLSRKFSDTFLRANIAHKKIVQPESVENPAANGQRFSYSFIESRIKNELIPPKKNPAANAK